MNKLTIGLPCYGEYSSVWFTVQALRMYHDLTDVQILIVDGSADKAIQDYVIDWCDSKVIYQACVESNPSPAKTKDAIFEYAFTDWVMCMDSHVLLVPGAIDKLKVWIKDNYDSKDLIQGPLLYDNLTLCADQMLEIPRGEMLGVWNNAISNPGKPPFEIRMQGMGLFLSRKDSWLRYCKDWQGFANEEYYIHEKYRQAGRTTICLPFLEWNHHFRKSDAPYPYDLEDKIRNYIIGFNELGLELTPLIDMFGKSIITAVAKRI